jgi:hypothetical protein
MVFQLYSLNIILSIKLQGDDIKMNMNFFRNRTQVKFTVIDKSILSNPNISLKDRGMLVTLLSLPDNWDFSINGLCKILPDGKTSINESLKRIQQKGYLVRKVIRDNNGKYLRHELEVYETPLLSHDSGIPYPDFPDTVYPDVVDPDMDFQIQYNNKIYNTKKYINKESKNSLTDTEYSELVHLFGKDLVDYQINKINTKGYKGCLNKKTLEQWCNDYSTKPKQPSNKNQFHNYDQREYSKQDYKEIEHALQNKLYR